MFSALLEATTDGLNGRHDGDRHTIIAIVRGEESECAPRAIEELKARGWRDIEVKRIGPVVRAGASETPGCISGALSDADETGFGLVVYVKPIKSS